MRRLLILVVLLATAIPVPPVAGSTQEGRRFEVLELGMQFNDPLWQFKEDVNRALDSDPVLVGFTETGERNRLRAMRKIASRHGYRLVRDRSGCGFLVRDDAVVVAHGFRPVIPSTAGSGLTAPQGAHDVRGVAWVRVLWETEDIWVGQVHLLTDGSERVSPPGSNSRLIEVTSTMATRNRKGTRLAFVMGDFNDRNENSHIRHMTSAWDELDRDRRSVMDIRSHNWDSRVRATRIYSAWWPHFSDHAPQVGVFRVMRRNWRWPQLQRIH